MKREQNLSYYRVSYHGVKVAAHLQQTLQGLHHLLLAERVESGVIGGFTAFQHTYCGFQSHWSTLENTHSWGHTQTMGLPLYLWHLTKQIKLILDDCQCSFLLCCWVSSFTKHRCWMSLCSDTLSLPIITYYVILRNVYNILRILLPLLKHTLLLIFVNKMIVMLY